MPGHVHRFARIKTREFALSFVRLGSSERQANDVNPRLGHLSAISCSSISPRFSLCRLILAAASSPGSSATPTPLSHR